MLNPSHYPYLKLKGRCPLPTKVVIFYNQGSGGFTETWYSTGEDPRTVANLLEDRLIPDLINWRHELTVLKAMRVSRIGAERTSYLRRFSPNYRGRKRTTSTNTPDVISTDAVIKVNALQAGSKRMFIRGLADVDVERTPTGDDKPSADLIAGLSSLVGVAQIQSWRLRIMTQPPGGALVWTYVSGVVPFVGNPTYSTLETNGAVPGYIAVGDTIIIQGVPQDDLPGFPRTARVAGIVGGGTPGVIIQFRERASANVYPTKMRFTKLIWTYPGVASFTEDTFERFSERKTGRPFGLLRGRARSVVRAL